MIQKALEILEKRYHVKVIYACEVGSRAWGYASEMSDHDIRFIYIHQPEWYLSIDEKKEVIEYPISNDLDFSGWDIRKALRMYRKSNPSLLEWLHSDTVLFKNEAFISRMQVIEPMVFSEKACLYHYLNMAKKNEKEWSTWPEKQQKQGLKLFFNILRPTLMCHWLMVNHRMPPLRIQQLVDIVQGELKRQMMDLVKKRIEGSPVALTSLNPVHQYIQDIIYKTTDYLQKLEIQENFSLTEQLDQLFLEVLKNVWDSPPAR